ncbi:MAG: hypothetical protein JKY53_14145 [Flavobacteriales bacterium]|nr:hypothetical protein [Flavobacteriales bacterium]
MPVFVLAENYSTYCSYIQRDHSHVGDSIKLIQIYDKLYRFAVKKSVFDSGDDSFGKAINHPLGQIVEMLIVSLWPDKPTRGGLLPEDLKKRLDAILCEDSESSMMGKCIMASKVVPLHYLDNVWVNSQLRPLFAEPIETSIGIWISYLYSGRLSPDFISDFSEELFAVLNKGDNFQDTAQNKLYQIIAIIGLDYSESFPEEKIQNILATCPIEALFHVVNYLRRRLDHPSTGSEAWDEYVWPFIERYWTITGDRYSSRISGEFAKIIIGSGTEFSNRFQNLITYLGSMDEYYGLCISILKAVDEESIALKDFPELLDLLEILVKDSSSTSSYDYKLVRECTDKIIVKNPRIKERSSYLNINEILLKKGFNVGDGLKP